VSSHSHSFTNSEINAPGIKLGMSRATRAKWRSSFIIISAVLTIPGHLIAPDCVCPGRGIQICDSRTILVTPGQLVILTWLSQKTNKKSRSLSNGTNSNDLDAWVTLKVTFAVSNLSRIPVPLDSGNIARINYDVCTRESDSAHGLYFQLSYWNWINWLSCGFTSHSTQNR